MSYEFPIDISGMKPQRYFMFDVSVESASFLTTAELKAIFKNQIWDREDSEIDIGSSYFYDLDKEDPKCFQCFDCDIAVKLPDF